MVIPVSSRIDSSIFDSQERNFALLSGYVTDISFSELLFLAGICRLSDN